MRRRTAVTVLVGAVLAVAVLAGCGDGSGDAPPDDGPADGSADAEAREATAEALAAGDRLIAWAAGSCEVGGPVWACLVRSSFRPVGEPISGEDGSVPPPDRSPEDAVADGDRAGERVEVTRTDDRVLFAWLDADGLAVRSEAVARAEGAWTSEQTSACDPGA